VGAVVAVIVTPSRRSTPWPPGNAIVVVTGGTPDSPLVEAGDKLEVEDTVTTSEVLVMLQENNKNLLAITTDIKGITGKIASGEGTAGKLIQDETLFTEVKGAVVTLQEAATNAKSLTASLGAFSDRLNTPGHLPHDLTTNETLMPAIAGTVEDLKAAVTQVRAVIERAGVAVDKAGVAVVPFTAFGYPEGTGWLRLSVGSVTMEAVEGTLAALRRVLTP
jgi:phospholipid/cholesterol/gamma-HCH transport system substrate-binding protein